MRLSESDVLHLASFSQDSAGLYITSVNSSVPLIVAWCSVVWGTAVRLTSHPSKGVWVASRLGPL